MPYTEKMNILSHRKIKDSIKSDIDLLMSIKSHKKDLVAQRDLITCCNEYVNSKEKTLKDYAVEIMKEVSDYIDNNIVRYYNNHKTHKLIDDNISKMIENHRLSLKCIAKEDFESYMLFTEFDRPIEQQFYKVRRKQLKKFADYLQKLETGNIDTLSLSAPPRSGKSALATFYLSWLGGRNPNNTHLIVSYSASIIASMYEELLRLCDKKGIYKFEEIFGFTYNETNAKDHCFNLGEPKRFKTFQFTSLEAGNAGRLNCNHLLYCDDLVSGIEEAMNRDRLDKLWATYKTDILQRKEGSECKELHIATRWSKHDIIGRLEEENENNTYKAKFIRMPALDGKDISNFDYPFKKGFTTAYYKKLRENLDDVEWRTIYQQEPIEREGILFEPSELRYYDELPKDKPAVRYGISDVKNTGEDYGTLAILDTYDGVDFYVVDVVFNNAKHEIVDAEIIDMITKYKPIKVRIESNNGGDRFADKVVTDIKSHCPFTEIETKYTMKNKEVKIQANSTFVKKHCIFKREPKSKQYKDFMKNLCSYSMVGSHKHTHDDAPDTMAMAYDLIVYDINTKPQVFESPL